jgi:hypothetical protein
MECRRVGIHQVCIRTDFVRRKSIGWGERRSGSQRSLGPGESSDPGPNGHPDRDHPDPRFVCETAAVLAGR